MTVHAESVIEKWVNDFYPEFYIALTNMENACYTNDVTLSTGLTPGLTYFKPLFTALQGAMTTWAQGSWQSQVADMALLSTNLNTAGLLYKTDVTSMMAQLDARNLFTMGGFVTATLSNPVDFYLSVDPVTDICKRIVDDTVTVTGGWATDSTKIKSIKPSIYLTLKTISASAAFSTSTGPSPSVADQTKKFFTDLHYKEIYKNLNVGGTVTVSLPAGV